jgi:hypothetical protein
MLFDKKYFKKDFPTRLYIKKEAIIGTNLLKENNSLLMV